MEGVVLPQKSFRFTDDEFYDFCVQNDSLKFERDKDGNIIIMPNTGGVTGKLNARLTALLFNWNDVLGLGEIFDSSTAFRLESSAVRSPDVAWISNERWSQLLPSEQKKFPPICPDFVIELMSESDILAEAKKKMQDEWIANGCRLGWLINPETETVYIYRANGEIQIIKGFDNSLSGEDVLPDFELKLSKLR